MTILIAKLGFAIKSTRGKKNMLVELPIWIIKHEKKLISVHFRAICFLPSFCEADTRTCRLMKCK